MGVYTNNALNLKINADDIIFKDNTQQSTFNTKVLNWCCRENKFNDQCYAINYSTKTFLSLYSCTYGPYCSQYTVKAISNSNVQTQIENIWGNISLIENDVGAIDYEARIDALENKTLTITFDDEGTPTINMNNDLVLANGTTLYMDNFSFFNNWRHSIYNSTRVLNLNNQSIPQCLHSINKVI
jgi:hypothetical protein